ncbi:hypothetical protein BV898_04862 [Hypsibius exemplaris]|uniref:EF-hand domain-containing protein n=1 Tax=Hypsibius exemplaris TaxID=2072580 RepID=A0A1W0X0X3_HYPEX|nr:hypothetical protein BV898_04862 [Hypsibius exemplaris]
MDDDDGGGGPLGTGYITPSDLRAVLMCVGENLTESEIDDMITEVDLDGDGRIDFDEFVAAMCEPDKQPVYSQATGAFAPVTLKDIGERILSPSH